MSETTLKVNTMAELMAKEEQIEVLILGRLCWKF